MVEAQDIEAVELLIKHEVDLDAMHNYYAHSHPLFLAVVYGL